MKLVWAILMIASNFVRTQVLTVIIMVVYLAGMALVFVHNQRSQEARFFLQLHSFYVIVIAMMVAVPAIHSERKSRRILAVLSKGIHRWQYLAGILSGCAGMSAIFCALIGGISLILCLRGGYPASGLGGLVLMLFLCSLMASAIGLFFGTFLHPLLATGAASATIALPWVLQLPRRYFPASWLADRIIGFQFGKGASAAEVAVVATTTVAIGLIFWFGASAIFTRRDVTISPE